MSSITLVDKTVNVEVFIPNSEAILDLIDVMGLEVHEESILDGAVSTVQLNDKEIRTKSLWMYGELDIKFKNLALKASDCSPLITAVPVGKAAHRCPWDNPEDFIQKILSFL
jgi:pimeloyl-ACP methyl ester carboxylesterase